MVLDVRNRRQEYLLTEFLQRLSPSCLRYTILFGNIHQRRAELMKSAALYLRRRHAGARTGHPHPTGWGIRIDEALFLCGMDKGPFLKTSRADIFFDDQH